MFCIKFTSFRADSQPSPIIDSSLRFTGRLGGHRLAPGRYRLYAMSANGPEGARALRRDFRIIR